MSDDNPLAVFGCAGALLAVMFTPIIAFGVWSSSAFHQKTITCTIDAKESTAKSGGHEYRIYTQDCGVLRVSDSLLTGDLDSADRYAALEEGRRYEMRTGSIRNNFFSIFPNILDAKEID